MVKGCTLLANVRKNGHLYRLTHFRGWYHVFIAQPNGAFNTFSYRSYAQATFIFSGLTGYKFNNNQNNSKNQLNLF